MEEGSARMPPRHASHPAPPKPTHDRFPRPSRSTHGASRNGMAPRGDQTMADRIAAAHRRLGGLDVSPLGLGCMSLSGTYGASDDADGIAVIHAALERGITLLDTSDMYGWGHNEEPVGRAIKDRRTKVVLATKFGNLGGRGGKVADGRPDYVISACEASLKRLGVEVIDLYYQHRVDPTVPIEETVGAMARLV